MNVFFDEECQKIIADAKKEMFELGHPYVGSEHLLLAILKNKKLDFNNIFSNYGIDYKSFKSELIKVVGKGNKSNVWVLFTPLLKKIINDATYYSKDNDSVTPYSLVVSLLQVGDGIANRILINMNINIDSLYKEFCDYKSMIRDNHFLNELTINMNEKLCKKKIDPVIGRDKELNEIIQVLLRKNKNNPLLIGKAGVGKTAIVEELVNRIISGNVPNKLKNIIVYSLSMSVLISGTKYRGEFEEKLNKIINEVINNPNIILFIDEFHTVMGAGGAEGAIDAANIFKPFLARDNIKVIGATTLEEYNKYLVNDKAFDRRFQKIIVEEPNEEELKQILLKIKNNYEKYHNVIITKEIIELIISLSNKCILNGNQPDKAIDLLDEVSSYVEVFNNKNEVILNNLYSNIKEIENKKNNSIINHDFQKAKAYKNKELNLRSDYNELLLSTKNKKIRVTKKDLYKLINIKTSIPINEELRNNKKQYEDLINKETEYNNLDIKRIINIVVNYDFLNNEKPLTMLFVKKSDLEKPLLPFKIAKIIFRKKLIQIDLKEYSRDYHLNKLIGSAPGYAGYQDETSFIREIKNKTFIILLVENIDKCHKKVLDFFIDSIKKGYIETGKGEKIFITKAIIFFTTSKKESLGFNNNIKSNSNNDYINYTFYLETINNKIKT